MTTASRAQLDDIVSWGGRTKAVLALLDALVREHPFLLRGDGRRDSISAGTFMAVLRAYVDARDHATGLIDAHHASIAQAVGKSPDVVSRALRIARRRLGIIVEIGHGRELTAEERLVLVEEGQTTGSPIRQHGLPPVRSTHLPAWLVALLRANTASRRAAAIAQGVRSTARRSMSRVRRVQKISQPSPEGVTPLHSPLTKSPNHLRGRAAARGQDAGEPRPRTRPGLNLARALTRAVPWASTVRPWAIATALAPLEAVGWTPQAWLDAALGFYRDLGWTPPRHITSPGGLITWLSTHLDPAAFNPTTHELHRAQPCGRPDCDLGWIAYPSPTGGHPSVRPCPQCPPIVRTDTWHLETERLADCAPLDVPDVDDPTSITNELDGPQDPHEAADHDLDDRLAAAWQAIVNDLTPLADLADPDARDLMLADSVRDRLSAYESAGLTLPQIDHVDPPAARRARAMRRIERGTRRRPRPRPAEMPSSD